VKRFNNVSKFIGAGALALSLTTLPALMPVSAQTNTGATTTTTTDGTTVNNGVTDGDRSDGDWGLMGLLGLFGLLGRKSRKHNETVAYSDPNAVGTGVRR
jgi:hypothetical protein